MYSRKFKKIHAFSQLLASVYDLVLWNSSRDHRQSATFSSQVIQSVQGSFDFLQDSLLDSKSEQGSQPLTAASAATGVALASVAEPTGVATESSPVGSDVISGHSGGASLGSQQLTTSSLLGASASAAAETMPSSLSFHDASPMIDDPAVMHVTGGTSCSYCFRFLCALLLDT